MDKNPLSLFAKIGAVAVGGLVTLSFASSLVVGGIRNVTEAKRKKTAPPCSVCDGRGFMQCKLCGGRATIEWSPLYDPVIIKPCVCPTCEGNRREYMEMGMPFKLGHWINHYRDLLTAVSR